MIAPVVGGHRRSSGGEPDAVTFGPVGQFVKRNDSDDQADEVSEGSRVWMESCPRCKMPITLVGPKPTEVPLCSTCSAL